MRQYLLNFPYMKETFKNAMSVKRILQNKFSKIPEAIEAPTQQLHDHPLNHNMYYHRKLLISLKLRNQIVFFDPIFC